MPPLPTDNPPLRTITRSIESQNGLEVIIWVWDPPEHLNHPLNGPAYYNYDITVDKYMSIVKTCGGN